MYMLFLSIHDFVLKIVMMQCTGILHMCDLHAHGGCTIYTTYCTYIRRHGKFAIIVFWASSDSSQINSQIVPTLITILYSLSSIEKIGEPGDKARINHWINEIYTTV